MEKVSVVLVCFGAQEIKLCRHHPGIKGEVLAYEVGLSFSYVILTEYFFTDRRQSLMHGRVVQNAGVISAEVQVDAAIEVGGNLIE